MGLTMFLEQVFHRGHVQHLVCNDPRQLGGLRFKRSQSRSVAGLDAAVLLAPAVERRRADAVAPTDIIRLRTSLALLSTTIICSSVKRFRFLGLPPSFIQR
jgi:hypothetical protein